MQERGCTELEAVYAVAERIAKSKRLKPKKDQERGIEKEGYGYLLYYYVANNETPPLRAPTVEEDWQDNSQ